MIDEKELWEKVTKLSPENRKIVDTYVDYLLKTKIKTKHGKPKEEDNSINDSEDKKPEE